MIRYENGGIQQVTAQSPAKHLLSIAGNSFELARPGRSPTDVGTS
ncbi:hypothetical protein [Shinella sp. M31]